MRSLLFLAGLFVCSWAEEVVTLTDTNFDEYIKKNDKVLVEFYAPWCGHCKALEPEYEKAAVQLKEEGQTTKLAKVDATIAKKVAEKFNVEGFPTLKYFVNGDVDSPQEYDGGREQDTIVRWVKKRALPALTELENEEAAEAFKTQDKITVIGYFKAESPEAANFKRLAESMRDAITCGIVTSVESKAPLIVVNKKFDPDNPSTSTTAVDSEGAMKEFINSERFALIDEIGPENYKEYVDRGLPLVWIAVKKRETEQKDKAVADMMFAAKEQKGKLSFVWIDAEDFQQHVENLGVKTYPGFVIVNEENNMKYLFEKEWNADNLKQWWGDYADGKIKPFMKSEDPPVPNDAPVKIIVGSTFEEMVTKNENAVFVEFYAPWCGHCKQLAPEWDKVGEHFEGKGVTIAKVDATENDTPERIEGFPTLVWYPAGDKAAKEIYEGERKATNIIEWVEGKVGSAEKQDL